MKKRLFRVGVVILLLCCLCACSKPESDGIPEIVGKTPGSEKWENSIDYGSADNWLSLPETPDKAADLIYFYPTVFSPEDSSASVISDIDDAGMRKLAAVMIDKQASAFETSCNLYAPFYRQLDAAYSLTLAKEEHEELFAYAVSQDASAALDYYFENYNDGRPFMLAGHSQGSETVLYLLTGYFKDHPEYYSRMIAAYIVGYSVTDNVLKDNPHLKFAQGETDTGVVISWNTEGPENLDQYNAVVLEGAKSINPINWKTDDTYASAEENKGSRINGEILYNIADAQIDLKRGTVITHADKAYAMTMPSAKLFGPASFHLNDYDLFYKNIEENARKRINAYLNVEEEKTAPELSEERQKSIDSIKKISDYDNLNLYSMEIFYDYDIENFLLPPGVYDDQEVMNRLLNEAVPGFDLQLEAPNFGCSAFTLTASDGKVYMGRNYDFKYDSSAMQVYCHPKDGYASVSYAALDNLKVDDPLASDQTKIAALASPFVCLDGMNEKGVAIAILTLPSEPTRQNTGKQVIPTAAVTRLVLDKAATTQEAVDLISQYDMYCTNGRDYHYYITDASGDGRIVEFDCDKEDRPMVVTPIRSITNYFGMYEDIVVPGPNNGKYGTGRERRDRIEETIERAGDNTDNLTAMAALRSASTAPNPESIISNTQWSIVYNLTDLGHEFVLHRRWADTFAFKDLVIPATRENKLSKDRIETMNSIRKLTDYDDYNVYYMDVLYDYSLKDMTPTEPADTQTLFNLMLMEAAPGCNIRITAPEFGCSAFSLPTKDGKTLMGRSYDFRYDSSCMMVHCKPYDGYESIAHAALNNLGADDPDSSEAARIACLAAPFVCLDGMNEKGVAIAVLTEDSEPAVQETGKPKLATTMLIRLVLDKAASTQEAVDLIREYDMYSVSGRDNHFFITDASGDSRTIEYDPDSETRELTVTSARATTNFYNMYIDKVLPNQKNGKYGHGLERYLAMEEVFDRHDGTGGNAVGWEALQAVAQLPNPESVTSNTQWSVLYNTDDLTYELVLRRRWDDVLFSDVLKE